MLFSSSLSLYISFVILALNSSLVTNQAWGMGPTIGYEGFTINKVAAMGLKSTHVDLKKNNESYCLGIIEKSPYESKIVYYTQRQFIELIRKHPKIREHLEENLFLPIVEFANFLWKNGSESKINSYCVGLSDILDFKYKDIKKNFQNLLNELSSLQQKNQNDCSDFLQVPAMTLDSLAKNNKFNKKNIGFVEKSFLLSPEDADNEAFTIRTYYDPRAEHLKYWRDPHLDEEGIRNITNVHDLLKISHKFLINYSMVTNKLKSNYFQSYDFPLQEERAKQVQRSVPIINDEDERYDEIIENNGNIENNVNNENQGSDISENSDSSDDENSSLSSTSAIFSSKLTLRPFSITDLTPRRLFRDGLWNLVTRNYNSIKKSEIIEDPNIENDNRIKNKAEFLSKLSDQEDKLLEKLENDHRKMNEKLSQRPSKKLSQDPIEKFEFLTEVILKSKETPQDLLHFDNLQKYLLGQISYEELEVSMQEKKTWMRKIYEPIRDSIKRYNWYATDTIVDIFMDHNVDASLKQIMPLSKNRSRLFLLTKAMDGGFVLTTNSLGLVFAPFTAGLSLVAAEVVNSLGTPVFSLATSMAKYESWDSTITRAGIRAGHAFTESLIPLAGTVNGFFTSIDDLRVAFKVNERVNRLWRKDMGIVKVRWETLGTPVILSFLRDRLNYVSFGLLPRGKFLLAYGNYDATTEKELKSIVKKLGKAKLFLLESLHTSRNRYEYLLKMGKIPNFMVKDVVMNLEWEKYNQELFTGPRFQEKNLITEMVKEFQTPIIH